MDDIDKLRQDIIHSETFCFYPFLELSTNPSGHVKPCCYFVGALPKTQTLSSHEDLYSITKDNTLEEVWNSEALIGVRKNLHQGTHVRNCHKCIRDGKASMRHRSISEYKNNVEVLKLVKESIDNNYVANHSPRRLELKPSNLCNLKCVMCNSYDSSQVAKELKELSSKFGGIEVEAGRYIKINPVVPGITENNISFNVDDTPDWSENKLVWESVTKIIPHLETLSFAGGEPTLIPFVEQTLRYCVDHGYAKNINVFISSNYTNINKSFVKLMPYFKKFELIASIDGIGTVNDYCRYPSKWSQVSKNFKTVKDMMGEHPNVKSLVNITVSMLNIMDLDQLLLWIDEQSKMQPYYKEWPYNINLLWSPGDQRVDNLPPNMRATVIAKLEDYKKQSVVLQEFPELVHKVNVVIEQLSKPYTDENAKLLAEFVSRVKTIDEHRGINITNYIPQLTEVFND